MPIFHARIAHSRRRRSRPAVPYRFVPYRSGPIRLHRIRVAICLAVLVCGSARPATAELPDGVSLFLKNGGWCWYQDPRAVIQGRHLIVGSVEGNGSGDAVVGVYDLESNRIEGRVVLHQGFRNDDHNAPVFYARPDGSLLAVYALHNNDRKHYYRISQPGNWLKWGDEQHYEHLYERAGNVTYMNLFALETEGKLYNFFRGIEFNPSFICSQDHGETWGQPTHFIQSELAGRHRPYARYAGDGKDTIHISFTDAHPRQFGNSIYYAAFRGGAFHRANGQRIKSLEAGGALKPSEAELVFRGGGGEGRGNDLSALRSAWTSSIAIDSKGHPHIGYTLYLSNTDHRYRLASWDGQRWIDREVAHAGKCLYDRESSYTGLITLDPVDPTTVLISTDVNPTTGEDTGGLHEIYRASVSLDSQTNNIAWEPVTRDSSVRNLRPVVARDGKTRVIAWLRGDFRTYTDYELDVVGIVETVK